ncbi:MAG: hypothetical protein ABIP97_11300, partial [Chthoniobacterales bacterium]
RKIASNSRRAGSGLGLDLGFSYTEGAFIAEESPAPSPEDTDNTYVPDARPGCRAPHFWMETKAGKTSSLDLFGKGWVLIAGSDVKAGPWVEVAQRCVIPIAAYQLGEEIVCNSPEVEKLYGIGSEGMVMIRPDGIVALRTKHFVADPQHYLSESLSKILRC